MKQYFRVIKLSLIFLSFTTMLLSCSSTKQTSSYKSDLSAAEIKNMIDSHGFIFVAESLNPLRGRFRTLTSRYDVAVSQDSLSADLPYFGRAYSLPIDPSQGGIKFTATKFSYDVTQPKSNKWNVTIKPQDGGDVQQLNFAIFDNGSASLSVSSNSKDPISYNGHLQKRL